MKGSFLITDQASNILFASPGCSNRAGFDIPEILGKKPGELWGGLMSKSYYEQFWLKIIRGEPYIGRVENKQKQGKRFLDEMHVTPLYTNAGAIKYFIEFHPELSSVEDRLGFDQAFLLAGGDSAEPVRISSLLSRWMDQDIPNTLSSRDALLRYLEQAYISEAQKILHVRTDDLELILEAQRHAEKFAELYIKYVFQVRAFFLHRVSEEALAEDFTHETFERAFRSLSSFTPSNASYLTYLLRIAHNLLVSHYRKTNRIMDRRPMVKDMVEAMERKDAIERGLKRLNLGDRQVIQLKYQEGKRVKEIAELLNRSENAIKLQLSRARKKLRNFIFKGEKAE